MSSLGIIQPAHLLVLLFIASTLVSLFILAMIFIVVLVKRTVDN